MACKKADPLIHKSQMVWFGRPGITADNFAATYTNSSCFTVIPDWAVF